MSITIIIVCVNAPFSNVRLEFEIFFDVFDISLLDQFLLGSNVLLGP
jgi:hypothetical protein